MSSERKQIVTAAGPNMVDIMQDYSVPTFEAYGEKQGYTVNAELIEVDNIDYHSSASRAARWHKIHAVRRSLQENDVVAWFDADVLILRDDDDIASHVAPDSFQAMATETVPHENRTNPNTGVWVMRNSTEAFEFLDEVEEIGMATRGKWADQHAVMQALGWNMGDIDDNYRWAGPGRGTHFIEGTSWLPDGWNQPYLKRKTNAEACEGRGTVESPHAVHFMGMSIAERQTVMGAHMPEINSSVPISTDEKSIAA